MKKILVLFTLVTGLNVSAQTDKQIEKVSESTCDCLNKKNIETGDMTRLQIELGVCMLDAISQNKIDVDTESMADMEKFGEKVGMKLAFTCPKFLEIIGEMAAEDPEGFESLMEDESDYIDFESTEGLVVGVESSEFVTIKVKNSAGRKETFYWMEYFDGANLLENGGRAIQDKNVYVEYELIEVYSPKIEDYTFLKVIRFLSIEK